MDIAVVILAAGKGKRMNSEIPKVLHPILGRPMIGYVIDAIDFLRPCRVVVVCGFQSESVKDFVGDEDAKFAYQTEQLGTGHAVLCAWDRLREFEGHVLILNGDLPLLRTETLSEFVNNHFNSGSVVSILTSELEDPAGYGRVERDKKGKVSKIVEERDATPDERLIKEVNAGAYCVRSDFLWDALESLNPNNTQHEYYLPDIVDVILGVNTRTELVSLEQILRTRVNSRLLEDGVTIVDPATTFISPDVKVGFDTVIHPNTYIYGTSSIGSGCSIGPSVMVTDSDIGHEVKVSFCSYITEAVIRDGVSIGPFAHLRPGAEIKNNAKIGNFVEVKKSVIGRGSKVPHLPYVGDTIIGEMVNIGAGSITCNYDGFDKHQTIIEDHVFIGSGTKLVAPVRVGRGSTTGAGSTITKDVPPDSLAVERSKQTVIRNWKRKPRKSTEDDPGE